jgi:hypothetical protein
MNQTKNEKAPLFEHSPGLLEKPTLAGRMLIIYINLMTHATPVANNWQSGRWL